MIFYKFCIHVINCINYLFVYAVCGYFTLKIIYEAHHLRFAGVRATQGLQT